MVHAGRRLVAGVHLLKMHLSIEAGVVAWPPPRGESECPFVCGRRRPLHAARAQPPESLGLGRLAGTMSKPQLNFVPCTDT